MSNVMIQGLVSIMMPAYNAAHFISKAIESVISQTYTNWELIVVDDGSTDGTGSVVGQYSDRRIKLLHQVNGGEGAARNIALETMRGEYLAFLDADDLYLKNHLEVAVRHLQGNPDLDGVYTDGFYIQSDGTTMDTLSSQRRGPFRGWIFMELVRASNVFGPPICVVLRNALINQCGLQFDPRITIGPDWDFLTRFSEHAKFDYLEERSCLYRVHQTNITVRTNRRKRAESLALCREKAIQLPGFKKCPLETQVYTFYDLLINLLEANPERQQIWIDSIEFAGLPRGEQARLLRLMAREAISNHTGKFDARAWLRRSRELAPYDLRGLFLSAMYWFNPSFCAWILQKKHSFEKRPTQSSPFGELL